MTTLQECQCCQCNEEAYQVANPFLRIWDLIKRIANRIKRIANRYREWESLKHNHRLLITMDDRLLKDIGLSRADAVRISNDHTFWKFIFQSESD